MLQAVSLTIALFLCFTAEGLASEEKQDARLREAQASFNEALKLKDSGKYSEALVQAEHARSLKEAVLGGMHPEVASCLNLVGYLHRLKGDLSYAEPLFQRALAIQEASFGNSHSNVASSLNGLALLYYDQGLYGRAEPLFQRALAIVEDSLGNSHPDVASALNNLANLYAAWGLYGRAEPLYQRALAIREAALGNSHPEVASSLNNLAILYYDQGLYDQAEPLFQRALAIGEAALGNSHPDVAAFLISLANLYYDRGGSDQTESLFQRALAIQEATFGNSHPNVASSLNNLANLYTDQGLYGRAEPLFRRALAIQEATFGNSHPAVAASLNNLALLYYDQGLYGRAESLFQRALTIHEASLGNSHPEVASSLNNLANLYYAQGLYGRAEPLFQRALTIHEASLGNSHPDVASSLDNLANLYYAQGLYGRAEPLFQRAVAIHEASLGNRHPEVASSLNNLANLYYAQGLYGRAEPFYQRALALREAALGINHPLVAESLSGLGKLRLAQHRLSDALPLFSRAFSISERRLRHEALDFSEARLSSFLSYLRSDEQRLYALLRSYPQDDRVQRLALGASLLLKGRSISETATISRTLHRSLSAEDRDTLERLQSLRTQLASLSLAGPGALSSDDYQQRLQSLAQAGDSLEADLAKRSAPLRAVSSLPSLEDIVSRVASSLPKDAALVEFIAYSDSPLVPKPGTPLAKTPRQERYLALVLFPDASTRAVDLGPAAPIDQAASRLRDALAEREVSFQSTSQQLYQLAFQPLLAQLGATRRLFLSPDGQLNLVPFSAVHDGEGFLLDSFDFTYLTSGRELLPRPSDSAPSSSVVVLADPDFTTPSFYAPSGAPPSSTASPFPDALEHFFAAPLSDLTRSAWVPLPGTRLEAQGIQRLLPHAQVFLGSDASKERLLNLPTPGILHLATHGFFLGNFSAVPNSRGLAVVNSLGSAPPPQAEPLLNSGLALAGARLAAPGAPLSPQATLVTALELAGLNLWGTQLVVLSACDTGRGEIHLGQGVYGLRRAFMAAGAETVLASLWKVNDNSTHLLMEFYYRNLLAGQGRASALREAMLSLRATHPHPHAWAPFIALGSDAPLHAITPALPWTPKPELWITQSYWDIAPSEQPLGMRHPLSGTYHPPERRFF
ncbi:CHAT domain-containing tetratricopeptide repeat protein [Stigmatella erecta]|uniref:CHAT domain-containing protein n=1 Tax=Stigmatella erecta TaxID=83460 RepID=A0A1I0KN49_9BACT|nr:CHAT domain-containing protein [Stigmatella erecta]SEU26483.1 CHAT domain-containing protein [Stigmatella erecta]